ncbi:MAG: hypothetical protein A3G33_02680 [Omnitrophica bacterium RIFCSPLOWO2_12_FULL_44_17]|uniref:Uncharacterized protein n=1 Tax=Candidatus Danuiimicrobium aquiferis TaxID=1801832 RepID=A0A1G1KRD0_9BACT|nr:MAG: hypothetical protein A3E74_08045 [Omnitrophica bacterium RIFCSPHIGHO2_12_FULL_44_12]OGW95514.1 MAG: hypothetical protein A3G33_02680 [Omnitrophica bacterium RIFCSPLOWO2_12_FULL_44_17]OGX01606.1 MAG: hypothetical protein A3J12_05775 [Omnitrophica bacterium RIFCSPLOWO2_02_FULL_44_11]
MESPRTAQIEFCVKCPALNKDVILSKDTWYGHILHNKTGHPQLKYKQDLLKKIIENINTTRNFFKFTDDTGDSWFYDYVCPDFKPYHDCLRIAFHILNEQVIIASAYPVKRGVVSYEPR